MQEFDLANNGIRQESKAVSERQLMCGRLHGKRQASIFIITIQRQHVPVGICNGHRPRAAYGHLEIFQFFRQWYLRASYPFCGHISLWGLQTT
jgi:hypothetical protein